MGSGITVDKHLTNIEEWFEVADKLDDIQFQAQITSHLGLWKVISNDNNQLATFPVQLQPGSLAQLFAKNQCYVFYAIRRAAHQNPENDQFLLSTQVNLCLQNLKNNIVKTCYMTPMKKNLVNGNQFRIYALFGKRTKQKQRLMTTSYCLKLNDVLESSKNLSIISSGGVLRNKKLQKGSVLQLPINQQSNIIKLTNQDIDFVQLYASSAFPKSSKPLSIFSFRSARVLPEIKTQKLYSEESSIYYSNIGSVESKKLEETKPQKKNGIEKINLKLDFSKPLSLSGLNLTSKKQQNQQNNHKSQFQAVALTNRSQQRRGKRQKCEEQCSQIIEGLYVSGQKVAKNFQTLQKHQIKYIINCAGDYCQNWFQQKGLQYLTFFLKDSQNQNIECLFYRVIEFVQNAQKNKENVLIHCIQGISRSVTFVIAYIIFKYGYDYKKAEAFVKQKRSIACPNNGFMVELIQFHKRLYDQYESLNQPRVFLVSSHSKETPHILTARMLKNPLFDTKKYLGLDSRGVYVIHLPQVVYVWVGSKCDEQKLQNYWTYANDFIKKLQKYERAPLKVKAISEGSEQKEFLALWNLKQPPRLFQSSQYDRLFAQGQPAKPGLQRQFYEQIEEQQQVQTKKLYIYPDYKTGLGVFSYEDLNGLCILCRMNEQKSKKKLSLHIWREDQFQTEGELNDEEFLSKVIETNYSQFLDEDIEIVEEDYEKPSEIFSNVFKN